MFLFDEITTNLKNLHVPSITRKCITFLLREMKRNEKYASSRLNYNRYECCQL